MNNIIFLKEVSIRLSFDFVEVVLKFKASSAISVTSANQASAKCEHALTSHTVYFRDEVVLKFKETGRPDKVF